MENKKEESPLIKGLKEFLDEVPPERLKELEKYNQFGPTVPDYLELLDNEKENIYLTSYRLRLQLEGIKNYSTNCVESSVLQNTIDLLYRMENEIFELRKNGWHPISEPPKDEEEVIAAGDYSTTRAVFHEGEYYIAEYYHNPESLNCTLNGVKWWCYPPKEE